MLNGHHRSCCFAHFSRAIRLRLKQLGQTEIKNLRVALTCDHDVVGFEIAMHDS